MWRQVDQEKPARVAASQKSEVRVNLPLAVGGVGLVLDGDAPRLEAPDTNLHRDIETPAAVDRALAARIDLRGLHRRERPAGRRVADPVEEAAQERGTLAVGRARVKRVREDVRQSEFVGAQVVERVETAREDPVEFPFHAPGAGETRGERAEQMVDPLPVGAAHAFELGGKAG